jgi:alkylation response protein AidB-like acyl-CoA dehydrogenase
MTIAAPALGLAECALEAYEERLRSRQNPRMQTRQVEWATSQMRVGQSVARLETAREKFFANSDSYMAQIERGEKFTVEQRVRYRMNMVEVVRICWEIVHDLAQDAGTGALFDGTTLQRAFRDMFTLRSHFAFRPESAAENAGRVRLGLAVESFVV